MDADFDYYYFYAFALSASGHEPRDFPSAQIPLQELGDAFAGCALPPASKKGFLLPRKSNDKKKSSPD